jgi:sulfide dehydrogenase [flavocytochrome c] flavoprotein subunit
MRGLGTFAAGHSAMTTWARAQASPRVVIIGGGVGGTTVATYLKRAAPTVHVTLIERNEQLTTSVGSNLFLGGLRTLPSITHSYDPLRAQGIDVVIDVAIDVDASRKVITLMTGARISYDRLVLSPGVDMRFDSIVRFHRWIWARSRADDAACVADGRADDDPERPARSNA